MPRPMSSRPATRLVNAAVLRSGPITDGKLATPATGKEYELWLTENGVTRVQGELKVWPSLTGSGYYFGSITFKADSKDPGYQVARLTQQTPGGREPQNTILSW